MTSHRWPSVSPPDELGIVAHGPAILARGPGIVMGLRCVFAHKEGLELIVALRAEGVQAEAASRQSDMYDHGELLPRGVPHRWSQPSLVVDVDGLTGPADYGDASSSSGDDAYSLDAHYWVGAVPTAGSMTVTASWPEAGLPETTTVLALEGLEEVADRIQALL